MIKKVNKSDKFHDPHGKRKKWAVTTFVLLLAGLILLVFFVFGKLLNDYIDFEATRVEAAQKLESIKSRYKEQEEQLSLRKDDYDSQINEKKGRLQQLNDDIAKRESKIATQQKLISEYDTLSEVVSTLQNDYLSLFKEWDALKQNNSKEEGVASAIKMEIESLLSQKGSLENELLELDKTKQEIITSSKVLKYTVENLEVNKDQILSDITVFKNSLDEGSKSLADINIQIDTAKTLLSKLSDDIGKEKAAYELAKSRNIFATEEVDSKIVERNKLDESILGLKNKVLELTTAISTLEDQKLQAEANYQKMENDISKAKARLESVKQQIESSIPPLFKTENNLPGDDKSNSLDTPENNLAD